MTDEHSPIKEMVFRAKAGLRAGKEVSVNAIGTRGFIGILAIDFEGAGDSVLSFTGAHGENHDAIFTVPTEALLAVWVKEPTS